jgi:hypothetical protein
MCEQSSNTAASSALLLLLLSTAVTCQLNGWLLRLLNPQADTSEL